MNGLIHTSICCPAIEATQNPTDDERDEELSFQCAAAAVVEFNLTYAAAMTMSGVLRSSKAILCHKTQTNEFESAAAPCTAFDHGKLSIK